MRPDERLSSSLEDYLETILAVVQEKKAARVKDIVSRMQVKASSVTGALRLLTDRGLINYAPYDLITLTEKGEQIARDVTRRHEILRSFFEKILKVDPREADDGACKLEHAISPALLDRLIKFISFIEQCPRGGEQWMQEFSRFCEQGVLRDDCQKCISQCLEKHLQDSKSK